MTFADLGLAAPILKALEDEGYTTPTPIQSKAIPPLLDRADLLGIAQTGTGKTAAFALPILSHIAADRRPPLRKGCRALVLSPTRELASQIADSFRTYGRHLGVNVAVVFGGVAHRPQIQALSRGVDVLVATPGRLLDHMETRTIDISGTEFFVLDEADQMLDLGFVRPIRQIVSKLAHRRQNLFFSATMPHEIAALAAELLVNPVEVAVAPVASTAERVSQRVIHIESARKSSLLVELLSDEAMSRTLVFTRTKRGADRVAKHLDGAGINAAAIHGNKSQRQREIALEQFKKARTRVLVATDIAARGIDIDAVSHVVNYELPEVPEAYVHRIGRTARAGAAGQAISLCDGAERHLLGAIERLTRQKIDAEDRRNDKTIRPEASGEGARPPRGATGGRGGNGRGDSRGRSPAGGFSGGQGDGRANGPRNDRSRAEHPRGEHQPNERAAAPGNRRPQRDDRHPASASGEPRRNGYNPAAETRADARPRNNDRGGFAGRRDGAGANGDRRPNAVPGPSDWPGRQGNWAPEPRGDDNRARPARDRDDQRAASARPHRGANGKHADRPAAGGEPHRGSGGGGRGQGAGPRGRGAGGGQGPRGHGPGRQGPGGQGRSRGGSTAAR